MYHRGFILADHGDAQSIGESGKFDVLKIEKGKRIRIWHISSESFLCRKGKSEKEAPNTRE
jgi:hypothetical protein